ncbi:hypothetical protein ACF06W_11795 [Streptomyces albus]|uniref:hypothetical protein n=1 Tax=Streptomyces albus TaxID=1888 RepID=UPI0036FFB663
MSRKHYRAFAQVLRQAREYYPKDRDAINFVVRQVADICAEDNRAFRRQQFYDAAEPETT